MITRDAVDQPSFTRQISGSDTAQESLEGSGACRQASSGLRLLPLERPAAGQEEGELMTIISASKTISPGGLRSISSSAAPFSFYLIFPNIRVFSHELALRVRYLEAIKPSAKAFGEPGSGRG